MVPRTGHAAESSADTHLERIRAELGWNDRVAEFLSKVKAEDGTATETAGLPTAFELMDYREGRRQLPKTP